ncbi:DUF721 domain-containing protein [Magnetovibrio sp.]|uniref:DUF721 domain-containing protein n=1 Tax=Magnetovibrio sp. TaxID=2024836 RepID=UPI002F9479B4
MNMAAKSTTDDSKKKPRGIVPSETRTRWAAPVALSVDRLTKRLLGKHGFTHGAIVTKWPEIVGDTMARHTQPEKIVFSRDGATGGTLHLKTDSGAFATQLQHQEPQIIERINTFFGYRAVVRIKLIQGPLPQGAPDQPNQPPRPLNEAEAADLSHTVALVDDPEIQEALARLGANIKGRNKDTD